MKKLQHLFVALSMAVLTVLATGCSVEGALQGLCQHSYGADTVTVAATCTNDGELSRECEKCGYVETEKIAKLAHEEEIVAAQDPTCTKKGWTAYVKCGVCDEKLTEPQEIAALGHKGSIVEGTAPTCTEVGMTDGVVCETCNEIYVEQLELAALGHKGEAIPGYAPTCTTTGLTDGEQCRTCGELLVEQEEIPILEHVYEWENDAENHWGKCTVCGEARETEEHDWDNAELDFDAENHWGKCTVCGAAGETEAHDYEDCEFGYDDIDHWGYCTVCGAAGESEEHNFEDAAVSYDETHHWLKCVDCENAVRVEHTFDYLSANDDSHTKICYRCTYSVSEEHVFAYEATEYGHEHGCVYCDLTTSQNCVDENDDMTCDYCDKAVSETINYNEVAIETGETIAGNIYRIYVGGSIHIENYGNSVEDDDTGAYASMWFYYEPELDGYSNFARYPMGPFKMEGITYTATHEYIDIHIEAGTYGYYTITEETSITTVSNAVRLVEAE